MVKCGTCNGKRVCIKCDGRGKLGNFMPGECPMCRGKKVCPICHGSGER